ncbi:MAG TPA: hypothetical protein VNV87_04500 [Acidimicrobiales bacterium]|jgi:hypothetical protein|nr:hypothetical protein [Acidimicrobiales bacterium]
MPSPAPKKTSTDQFMRMGQTKGEFGNDPSIDAVGPVGAPAVDIKP